LGKCEGSYWSWDPKETWALITWFSLLIYMPGSQKEGKRTAILGGLGSLLFDLLFRVNFRKRTA
jgi:cytochrome c biogenesis factor